MGKPLGPTFGNEVIAAGLGGLPFSWGENTDNMVTDQLTPDQMTVLQQVIDAHDSTMLLPPVPDANVRLTAGIDAAITAAEDVRDGLHAIPSNFNAANFQQFLLQAKILADSFVAMLEAQSVENP